MAMMDGHGPVPDPEAADARRVISGVKYPIVIKDRCSWPVLSWTIDDWSLFFGDRNIPFRCKPENISSSEPCWERKCTHKSLKFDEFVATATSSGAEEWMYFDYKHFPQWVSADTELFKQISWDSFGFGMGAAESTLWIGSEGAHTPCHRDTYGRNIVVQVYGRKRWLLFPPECGNMKPTRVPYEESSIYSLINFSSLDDDDVFRVSSAKSVVLEPGDALVVPPRWWHYVEHVSPIGISINVWLKNDVEDAENLLEEALVRFMVTQLVKDLPERQIKETLNPNEDDLPDTPLSVILSQVKMAADECLIRRSIDDSNKRQKIVNKQNSRSVIFNINEIIDKNENFIVLPDVDASKLIDTFCKHKKNVENEKVSNDKLQTEDCCVTTHLTTSIINSFCDPVIISAVKNKLLDKIT